ncbi:hypothetical protein FXF51_50980 [Nonomuraea sp. PA05]|uniref:hypothetical protein n=1 Tax=Nonomuraea sp. PA05 TaxID=2604466 RepID=UPI0011D3E319|nr:hypothetical protein [Nonomuraea sp. PA05]TYB52794.1 hypothetical protein FXF51_50980 [Nonomuraea sp. PA05]
MKPVPRPRPSPLPPALLTVLLLALLPPAPAAAATWAATPTPNASNGHNSFTGVDALTATDAWAVGRADHAPNQPFDRPLAARWNGTAWSITPTATTGGRLSGVDGSASGNVWAVGSTDTGPLAERWNGSSWSAVPTPTPPGALRASLSGVKTFSGSDAWAVGSYTASSAPGTRTLIQRWNGTSWSTVPSPSPDPIRNLLTDVDGASAGDVWAIGNYGDDGYGGGTVAGLVLHWNGSAWSQVNVPGAVSDSAFSLPVLQDVFARSASDVWIVGRAFSRTDLRFVPIALHWNGQTWQRSAMPGAPNGHMGFEGVVALSATSVYAVGAGIARWTGTAWVAESGVPAGDLSDAAATGPTTVWGVGSRPGSAALRTLAVRTTNG